MRFSRTVRATLVALLSFAGPSVAGAQSAADTTIGVTFGGFVDAYYAFDFNRPRALDRMLTTQAARHDEFNINLAYLDAALSGPRVRGRLAVQFGTAVQANYASEPRVGTLSGPDVSRYIQEAFIGYRLGPSLWVDGGVFFSPFGSESWISRDNWTYTRSLIAESSPYYEAGVKLTWQATKTIAAQLHVINGWQNISETNSDKALGARIDLVPSDDVAFAYDVFVGNEQPDSARSRVRLWQEAVVQLRPFRKLQLRGTFDYGMQRRDVGGGSDVWRGWAAIARWSISPAVAMAGRIEGYSDPEQVIVITGHDYGLRATGGSLTLDVAAERRALWRTELRLLGARDPIFPGRSSVGERLDRDDVALVSSLAITF